MRHSGRRAADGDLLRDRLQLIAGEDLRAYRDRALLAIGMAGAFRRSELVALTVGRVSEDSRGLLIRIISSKTDQEEGKGHTAAIPDGCRLEPVRHYQAWLEGRDQRRPGVSQVDAARPADWEGNERAKRSAGGKGLCGRGGLSARALFRTFIVGRLPHRGRAAERQPV